MLELGLTTGTGDQVFFNRTRLVRAQIHCQVDMAEAAAAQGSFDAVLATHDRPRRDGFDHHRYSLFLQLSLG
jgi:hypothetical protein